MTTERIHRTKEQWEALQEEKKVRYGAAVKPEGRYGMGETILADIDLVPWVAPSVADLRAQGLRVTVRYIRRYGWVLRGGWYSHKADGSKGKLTERSIRKGSKAKGGRTSVLILDPQSHRYGEGTAYCTAQDNFDKRKGYVLACNRALEELAR